MHVLLGAGGREIQSRQRTGSSPLNGSSEKRVDKSIRLSNVISIRSAKIPRVH